MPNRLISETSPYLLQHADNPVDWHPWDDESLALARQAEKPILLSIGYSACHWCHVMAHESFADPATAAVMNEHYVNIKVDREERPDLDKIYQLAHQLLTQQNGGWPLTMFLDPDTLVPFFGGTYFPRTPRHQLPGFTDLLLRIAETWTGKRDAVKVQGQRLADALASLESSSSEADTGSAQVLLDAALEALSGQYDNAEGGFGNAPKFPMPATLTRVLRSWAASGRKNRDALNMVMTSLTKMARGGIYDHLGGGFCRYATDRKWMIPHFEKMLYDNGQLLSLYADALAIGPDELFARVARETADWLLRDMQHPAGGFYAAVDADSEGVEGKYYVWRRAEIKGLLDETEYLIIETLYGLDKPANFEGKWNLHRRDAWRSVIARLSLDTEVAEAALASARKKLLDAREKREPPARDDKILTAWNGLAVKGLVKASLQLDEPRWIDAAMSCVDFIRRELWDGNRLYATWKGSAKTPGFLDDYANLLDALLTLMATRWRESDAAFALALADQTLELFEDKQHGGFYFTAETKNLIHRPKPTIDDALPPGNAVLAEVLCRLGHLFGRRRYTEAAERTLTWAGDKISQHPAAHCSLLNVLELIEFPPEQVIIRGPSDTAGQWLAATHTGYTPRRFSYAIPYAGSITLPDYLPKLISAEQQQKTIAYRCQAFNCSLPIEDIDTLLGELGVTRTG